MTKFDVHENYVVEHNDHVCTIDFFIVTWPWGFCMVIEEEELCHCIVYIFTRGDKLQAAVLAFYKWYWNRFVSFISNLFSLKYCTLILT